MKSYSTYEDSLRRSYDTLINFEYIMTYPETKYNGQENKKVN